MALQHFSHEHPLNYIPDEDIYDEDGNICCCNACAKPMMSITSSYTCTECNFYLHKSCAELPQEKIHPLHPDHPLTLLPKPLYNTSLCSCDCCDSEWGNFTYNCSLCEFDLDIVCASLMDHNFDHPSHEHPLTRMKRPTLSQCDACDTEHKGFFCICNKCPFMIHQDCLLLPYRIDYTDHPEHLLALAYSTPPQYVFFRKYCEICTKKIDRNYAVYYCGECRYFVHTNCVTSRYESFMSILHPWTRAEWTRFKVDLDRPGIVKMPVSDESVSLVDYFASSVPSIDQSERTVDDGPFIHFSHSHQLTIFKKLDKDADDNNDDDDDKLILEGKCCHLHNKKNDQLLCGACIQPINTTIPFYRCIEKCGFFIHISCAELPAEIQHPGHPQHTLLLLPRSPTPFGLFQCKGCTMFCNGFVYNCSICDDYKLDAVCGSLPKSIQHESHNEHILSVKPSLSVRCRASGLRDDHASSYGFSFAYHCESCDFELLPICIQLPREIKHRYDKEHPFVLAYLPIKAPHHSGQYICDICEKELNPRWWFYHCVVCDYSMHRLCLSQFDLFSRLKYGGTFTVDRHPHPLTFLPTIEPNTFYHRFPHVFTDDTDCDTSGACVSQGSEGFILKCMECNFKLHTYCALLNEESDGL